MAYAYENISKVRVKNFRNIDDVTIDFEESPIVALIGDNEAGKTSIIKAIAALALHANPRDQKEWIRDSTRAFGIEVELEGGTKIVRAKSDNGMNLYKIFYSDGTTWEANKLADGLPKHVQDLMGFISEDETGEYLHIRTYEDKLLFVVTPDSTNYKVMYNALKVEQLTKAIRIGSDEVNNIRYDIHVNENSLKTLYEQSRALKVYDLSELTKLKGRLKYQLSVSDKIERVIANMKEMHDLSCKLGPIALIDRMRTSEIDETRAYKVLRASEVINRMKFLSKSIEYMSYINNTPSIEEGLANKLNRAIELKESLKNLEISCGSLIEVYKTESVEESVASLISRAIKTKTRLNELDREYERLNTNSIEQISNKSLEVINRINVFINLSKNLSVLYKSYSEIIAYLEQVTEYLKYCGVAVEECPKCGEAVIIDLDKIT